VDDTGTIDDGTESGNCMPATGDGVITLKANATVNFVMSGLDCTVPGVEPQGMFNGTLRLNGVTGHDGSLRGLGSIRIGDIGGGTAEVLISAGVEVVVAAGVEKQWLAEREARKRHRADCDHGWNTESG